jgi:hypothetical protein
MSVTNPGKRKRPPPPNCASRTELNDGAKIHAAMKAQQRADLLAYPGKGRRKRTAREWREEYEKAMAEKRAAQSKEAAE